MLRRKQIFIYICFTCLIAMPPLTRLSAQVYGQNKGPAAVAGFRDSAGQHLDVLSDGKPIVRYVYRAYDASSDETRLETYKPFHHVMDPSGTYEITKGAGGQYTHHRALFIGWNQLEHNGAKSDLWHMHGKAHQSHVKFLRKKADDDKTVLSSRIDWITKAGETAIRETRTVTVHHKADPRAYLLLDFESKLKAVKGEVKLNGDPEHGGMQYRPHNDVVANKSAKYTFHAEDVDPKQYLDLPWAAMTYELKGSKYTVQHLNHPDNPRGTVHSAYRDYGRFGAFFQTTLQPRQTLKLKYRIRITLGDPPAREVLAEQYEKYFRE